MKINQIVTETTISEAPGGNVLGNLAKKAGAKVAGAVGAKATAAGIQGGLDANARAKEIFTQYRSFMGQTGANHKKPNAEEVIDFLQKQKLPTKQLAGKTGPITPKEVDTILQGVSQDSFKGQAGQAAVGQKAAPASLGDKFGGGAAGGVLQGAPGGIPADIQKAIDALSPQDKAELAKLL